MITLRRWPRHHPGFRAAAEALRSPADALAASPAGAAGAVLLRTCERVELYADLGPDTPPPGRHPERDQGTETPSAAAHLFRVAAGLDSRLPGETHVLGQVRSALKLAAEHGSGTPALGRLFERAIRVGRAVRNRTALGDLATDFGPAAAACVAGRLDRTARVGVIGCGAVGRDALLALRDLGFRRPTALARHAGRAAAVADLADARVAPLDALPTLAPGLDAIIAATSARAPIVTPRSLGRDRPEPDARPLLVVDLGEPPNAAPETAALPGVELVDMDRLAGRVAVRAAVVEEAERLAQAEAERFDAAELARAQRHARHALRA